VLLKGLDATELKLSQVAEENPIIRIDSSFFAKAALEAEARIKRGKWEQLQSAALAVESFGAYDLTNYFSYAETGIPFLRGLNIKNGFVDFADALFVDKQAHQLLAKSAVRPGMVLLTMSGTVGNAAVALDSWSYPVNSNQDIAKITPKPGVRAQYLAAFLGSVYGRIQIERLPVGSVQQHIFLWMIERLAVARLSDQLEKSIAEAVSLAYSENQRSISGINSAEQTLLRPLGSENWRPPEPLTYTRSASDVFGAGRIDSEFFAPRVDDLLRHLRPGDQTVGSVAPARCENFIPGGPGEFDYLEIGSVRTDGTITSQRVPKAEAPSRATWLVKSGDVVTSTVRPLRRLSALITPEQDGFVASSGFLVLQPQSVPAEVLLTYLRLRPVCELMDLHTSASLYPAISERDLLKLPFPKIPSKTCEAIVRAVRAAHTARCEAQELLARAQRAVEIAIEDSEKAAFAFLRE